MRFSEEFTIFYKPSLELHILSLRLHYCLLDRVKPKRFACFKAQAYEAQNQL